MKLRILISAVLVTALALPVIATTTKFPDVPDDHQHADAIRWASDPEVFNGNPLFRGFVDGNFGPDTELTEGQFTKVVDRLFDSVDRWTRAETAALLYHGLRNGTTTTTTSTTTAPATTAPPVVVGEGHPDRNKLRDVLENAVTYDQPTLEAGDVVLVEVRVKAPDAWRPHLRLMGHEQAVAPDQTGRFQLRYRCNNLNKGEPVEFQLVYRLPEPDIGGHWIERKFWSETLTTPNCQALQPYRIDATAVITTRGKVGLKLTETKTYQDDTTRTGVRYQYVEPWEYRLRTTKNGCHDHTQPYQPAGGGGHYFWFDHDECLENAAWWWVDIRWPALGETRQTERCRYDRPISWNRPHDNIIDECGEMTGPAPITTEQGAGVGDGWFELKGYHQHLEGCYIPDITQCDGWARARDRYGLKAVAQP